MSHSQTLKKIQDICLALPDAVEEQKWGNPHFCVNKKIFAGCGVEDDVMTLGFKLEMSHAKAIIQRPGFWKAPYVGHRGWVSMAPQVVNDWELIRELILESYQLIAPKKSLAKLGDSDTVTIPARKKTASKQPTRKKSTRKKSTKKK